MTKEMISPVLSTYMPSLWSRCVCQRGAGSTLHLATFVLRSGDSLLNPAPRGAKHPINRAKEMVNPVLSTRNAVSLVARRQCSGSRNALLSQRLEQLCLPADHLGLDRKERQWVRSERHC